MEKAINLSKENKKVGKWEKKLWERGRKKKFK